jgi:hypothetical protein
MINKIKKYSCTLLLVFVLASCSLSVQITPAPDEKLIPTPFVPTETATSARLTLTNTVVPSTVTPHPTLAPSDVTQFINKLASTDEICIFPCWGGIVPGKTNWSDISSLLASFAKVNKHSPSSPKGYAVYIPLSNQYPNDLLWLSIYLDENDIVKYIHGWRYNLPIDQILGKYGKPEQIYLFVLGVLPSDSMEEFRFLLSYEEQGFFVVYSGETQNQPHLEICPSNITEGPYFWLWSPQDLKAMSTIVSGGPAYYFYGDWSKYQEISIATQGNITIDWFYETYSNPANVNTCIQVPSPSVKAMDFS